MATKPYNPQAFPLPYTTALEAAQGLGEPGMGLRDWLAGQLAPGIVAALMSRYGEPGYSDEAAVTEAVRLSVVGANAMLGELAKEQATP